jgi:hypothetical protein
VSQKLNATEVALAVESIRAAAPDAVVGCTCAGSCR